MESTQESQNGSRLDGNGLNRKIIKTVAIRFAGDSGDGMQLTGTRFSAESAHSGNDFATRPDFPAEIRAPAGSLPGVSSFQIQIGGVEIFTAGDQPDALVAMNPAALKAHLGDLRQNGLLICNADGFTEKNLTRVGYHSNPLEDPELATKYTFISAPITSLTHETLKDSSLSKREIDKCKNFFALGVICWLYGRPIKETRDWLDRKFKASPEIAAANRQVLEAGMAFAQAAEIFDGGYEVPPAEFESGTYRNITGNTALAYGLVAGAELAGLQLFYAGYPITPASDVLHDLARLKEHGVLTFQAEDEIAAACAAIGASFGGMLGVTASSGPGIALKQEAIGLAAMAELPLVIVNVQRAGPSTGLPTKTEQADLLEVLFGRNGECPCAVVAASSPADVFDTAIEACRIAIEHMTPVFLLSEGMIGIGSEPWKLPDVSSLPKITPVFAKADDPDFQVYKRNPETLARLWALPGTKGLEHRIGGLEKQDGSGAVSYNPDNHHNMICLRAEKIERVTKSIAPLQVHGPENGDLLVLSWGGTYGSVRSAVSLVQERGRSIAHLHLRHLNPLPADLGTMLARYKKVVIPERNLGQLKMLVRSRYLIDAQGINRVSGQPFRIDDLVQAFEEELQ